MAHESSSDHERDNYSKEYDKFRNFVCYDELKEKIMTHGTTIGLCKYINTSLTTWKVRQINIAVSGITGSGKSSLINALRGMKPSDKGAAKVGVTETTERSEKYTYPKNDHVAFWDLPGLDEPRVEKESYIKSQISSKYDVVIIVTVTRFRDNDIWLAKECLKAKKNVLFVRTKIDNDIESDKHDYPDTSEEQCLEKIRKNMAKHLRDSKISSTDCDVFLVSSRDRTSYDFDNLDAKLRGIINIRGKAIHAILKLKLTSAIKKKRELSKTDFKFRKFAAVLTGFLPIPNLETAAGNKSIYEITKTCLAKFCLDEESFDTFCKEVIASKNEIMRQLQSCKIKEEEKQSQYETAEDQQYSTFGKYSKYMLPAFGSLMSAYKSYKIADTCLEDMCNMFAKDELRLVEIRLKELEDSLMVL